MSRRGHRGRPGRRPSAPAGSGVRGQAAAPGADPRPVEGEATPSTAPSVPGPRILPPTAAHPGDPATGTVTASAGYGAVPHEGRPRPGADQAGPVDQHAEATATQRSEREPPAEPPRTSQGDGGPGGNGAEGQERSGATLAQLRRFIKSRPYMPMHELRRRFGLDCEADEVHPIDVGGRTLYVGLPDREAGFVGELIRTGEVGYELLLDPACPLVIGVYAMRPVVRS
jgi:hypothetical protein